MNEVLPEGWLAVFLGDVASAQSGVGFPKEYQGKSFGDYPVYKVSDISRSVINNNSILGKAENYVSTAEVAALKGVVFKKGSTLFAKIGEAVRLNRRAFLEADGLADNNVMGVKPLMISMDKFIFHYLNTVDIGELTRATTIPSIRKSDIENILIPLPPLAEQQEIATRLDDLLAQVDAIKARLDAIPAILKRFRQAVLAAAVSGKLTEDINQVSWSYLPLENLIEQGPQNGLYKPATAYGRGVKIIRIDNFYDGYITNWGKVKKLEVSNEELNTWRLNLLDILINRVNSIEYLGKCALVTDLPESTIFESNIMRLSLNRSLVNPYYIRIFLTSLIGIERLRANAKLAVNQASINQQDVRSCLVNLPPLPEQTEIVNRVEQLFAFADQIEQQVQAAQTRVNQLTQAILAKAFKGELTAAWRAAHPELISGEHSAEALLEKIKATQASIKPKRGSLKLAI